MKSYLLEIGCEELPPKAILTYKEFLKEYVKENFKDFFIYISPENIKIYATPRRLAVLIKNLKEKQDSKKITLIGPPYKVSVDNEGKFTKAALSFAEKNSIPLEKLEKINTEKGEYLGATIEKEGESLETFIKHKIPQIFNQFPQLKSMKWNNTEYRFPRPIRWIVSLLDNQIVEFEVAGVKADRFTYLHRFMTKPIGRGEKKEINHANDYEEITKLGYIIADFEDRKHSIKTQYEGFARQLDANIIDDEELIEEITCLTEFPIGIIGDFSPEYLILPKEVIITVCKHHQRYLNFEKDGKLIPKFLAFSNNAVKDRDVIKNGYEKVLRARLEDALFFYNEDLKKNLDENIEKLKGIQFHEKLGSMYDKVNRNLELALKIANLIGYQETEKIKRAVMLSKADLLTEMVKEFDELQGIMGMYYSQKQGEDKEISLSIYEHYLPKTAEDNLPETNLGTIIALADKLDTVISFIKIGEIPKPSADPFGIRRNAIAVVRLLIEKKLDIDLKKLTDDENTIDFILSRLESYLQTKGFKTDLVNAVLSLKDGNIFRNYLKVKALSQLRELPDYESVITVFKRVGNIIPENFKISLDRNLLMSDYENAVYDKFVEIKDQFKKFVENREYEKAISLLLDLKPFIDRFFDNVMIMVEDEKIKNNRLSLLKEINDLFRNIADFTKLIGG